MGAGATFSLSTAAIAKPEVVDLRRVERVVLDGEHEMARREVEVVDVREESLNISDRFEPDFTMRFVVDVVDASTADAAPTEDVSGAAALTAGANERSARVLSGTNFSFSLRNALPFNDCKAPPNLAVGCNEANALRVCEDFLVGDPSNFSVPTLTFFAVALPKPCVFVDGCWGESA